VDGKKREMLGLFKNSGLASRVKPKQVNDHDFRTDAIGVELPYGIYDVGRNTGAIAHPRRLRRREQRALARMKVRLAPENLRSQRPERYRPPLPARGPPHPATQDPFRMELHSQTANLTPANVKLFLRGPLNNLYNADFVDTQARSLERALAANRCDLLTIARMRGSIFPLSATSNAPTVFNMRGCP
jgi:hypothetical protein